MESIENYFTDKNNETYQKTIKIFENNLGELTDNIDEFKFFNKHCIFDNENFLEEFVPNKIEKYGFAYN
jgi:hypothetical protein